MIGSQPPRQVKGAHSTSASTRMKIHLTPRMGDLPRSPVEKAGAGSQRPLKHRDWYEERTSSSAWEIEWGQWEVDQRNEEEDEAQDEHTDKMESGEVDWENLSSDCFFFFFFFFFFSDSSVRGPRGKTRTHMQPASKRSRSTQVSEEFARRLPSAATSTWWRNPRGRVPSQACAVTVT